MSTLFMYCISYFLSYVTNHCFYVEAHQLRGASHNHLILADTTTLTNESGIFTTILN